MNDSTGKPAFGPKNPFKAEVIERRLLNGPDSEKETVFLRLSLGSSGAVYEAGDLLGVYVKNQPDAVEEFLAAAHLQGDADVKPPRSATFSSLCDALTDRLHFSAKPTLALVKVAAQYASNSSEREALEKLALDGDMLAKYSANRQIREAFSDFPSLRIPAQALAEVLPPLNPRLYSIASSPLAYPDEAHIAVTVVNFEGANGMRKGVASSYLADSVKVGDVLPVFTAKGKMRLPVDDSRDIVMIGPGTGVAPFRAFLQEREKRGARGRNWLFYGHRHEACDFYFKDEIEAWSATGLLSKLSLAWSRDGAQKRYVQHLMWEDRRELIEWINGGANIYICGDKTHMAADVEATLFRIGAECGNASLLDELKRDKRLQSDTY